MYIELDKAIEAVNGAFEFEVETPDNYRDIAVETLKLLPSVEVVKRVSRRPSDDMVKAVRCKDCKHADLFYPYCTIWEAAIDGDGYCYKGEKE